MIVYRSTAALDNEDILPTNRVFDFAPCLTDGEFAECPVANWQAQNIADILC
jgi:hypothetical protein